MNLLEVKLLIRFGLLILMEMAVMNFLQVMPCLKEMDKFDGTYQKAAFHSTAGISIVLGFLIERILLPIHVY